MKAYKFPYIAVVLGTVIMLIVMKGSQPDASGATLMPLLTLLVLSEFAFFVSAFGVFIGVKHLQNVGIQPLYLLVIILCGLFAIRFMWLGIKLWPL